MREALFALLLLAAAAMVVIGVTLLSVAAGWIAAGVTLAGFGWLVLGERPDTPRVADLLGDDT